MAELERQQTVRAPGTCGELVQGFLKDKTPFHITCPINRFSTIAVSLVESPSLDFPIPPKTETKIVKALRLCAELLDLSKGRIFYKRQTELITSKGMGSSTADILAAANALSRCLSRHLSFGELAKIATSVESSDGTMYPGIVAINHKNGEIIRRFCWWPEFWIVAITPKENLETSQVSFQGKDELGSFFEDILDELRSAEESQSEALFADVATASAKANSKFVTNKVFRELSKNFNSLGALGLNIAHTGTMAGLLFSDSDSGLLAANAAIAEIEKMAPEGWSIDLTRTQSGRDWE